MVDLGDFDARNHPPGGGKKTNPDAEYLKELQGAGFDVEQVKETPEGPVRCNRNGSRDKPAWYFYNTFQGYSGGRVGFGSYGDWRDEMTVKWSSVHDISAEQSAQFEAQRARHEKWQRGERERDQERIAAEAVDYLQTLPFALSHPYLIVKGIKGFGARIGNDDLIIPMHTAAGEIRSYQRILPNGKKLYLKGAQRKGLYYLIGSLAEADRVYIVEGFATGATVHAATGAPVVVAFDTSGLKGALAELRTVYQGRVTFAGDNDASGAGERAARAALDKHSDLIIPPIVGADFNDLGEAETAEILQKAPQSKPLLERLSSLQDVSPPWLIKGVIPANSLSLIFGPSGAGKSFVAIDMGLHIARGENYHGHLTKQPGAVVYVCGEGHIGIKRRAKANAIANHFEDEDPPFYVSRRSVPMLDVLEASALTEEIAAIDQPIALVIFDTLNRNFGAGDENSTADVTKWIAAADRIKDRFNTSCLVVHHTGLATTDRARGSSALKAALDCEIMVSKTDDGVNLIGDKMKDGANLGALCFDLQKVHLGVDDDGDDYGSLVPILKPGAEHGAEVADKLAKMGEAQATMLEDAKAFSDQIKANLDDLGTDRRVDFTAVHLKEYCIKKHGKYARHKFSRTFESLVNRGLIGVDDGWYWVKK